MFWTILICNDHSDTRDLFQTYRKFKIESLKTDRKKLHCELLQTDVTKGNLRQGLSLNLFQLMNKYTSFTNFFSKNAELGGSEDC